MTQRVLVTGAASGLGAALTAAFRARGDEVLATDVSADVVSTPRDERGVAGREVQGRQCVLRQENRNGISDLLDLQCNHDGLHLQIKHRPNAPARPGPRAAQTEHPQARGNVRSGRRAVRAGEALTFGGEHSSIAILIAS